MNNIFELSSQITRLKCERLNSFCLSDWIVIANWEANNNKIKSKQQSKKREKSIIYAVN